MKKIIYFSIMVFLLTSSLWAQLSFYGDFSTAVTGAIPDEDGYDSLLNPGNTQGVKDLSLTNSLISKLAGGDELAHLELWFTLDQFSAETGLDSLEMTLQRAMISWYMGDNLRVKLGRQSMLSGYGYGWNPMDFANPLKDPFDPDADLKGVDAVQIHIFPFSPVNVKLYGLYEENTGESGVDYHDLIGGGELTAPLPYGEVKFTGLYEYDSSRGDDSRVSALGAGFLADIGGVGFYGEDSLLFGSRNLFSDGAGNLEIKDEILFSFLLGLEYTFPVELTVIMEYFYNGEGYNGNERDNYADDFRESRITEENSADYKSMYRPGYFSHHYLLMNLYYPLYEKNIDLSYTEIFSVDSGAYTIIPSVIWYGSGSFSLELQYSGLFSLYGDRNDENSLSPVKNAVSLKGTYSY